jgi:hypothetical protein
MMVGGADLRGTYDGAVTDGTRDPTVGLAGTLAGGASTRGRDGYAGAAWTTVGAQR